MRRRDVVAAITSTAAVALALAWPFPSAQTSSPAPLDAGQQLAEYQRSLDDSWQRIVDAFPDARRPASGFVTEMTRDNFDETLGGCLRDAGFETSYDGTGFSLTSPPEMDAEEAAIDQYACEAAFPWSGTLERLESVDEREATYDYYTRFLAPCLVLHGMPTSAPPPRSEFAAPTAGEDQWHPFSSSFLQGADQSESEALERDCPSAPPWQRDGGSG